MVKPKAIIEGFPHSWQIKIINDLDVTPVYWTCSDLGNRSLMPKKTIFHDSLSFIKWKVPRQIFFHF